MNIENDIKLDFDDVLIKPKRSEMTSRADVQLEKTYKFLHTSQTWTGFPIIAANMDTIGTKKMAISLAAYGGLTALHKYHNNVDIRELFTNDIYKNCVFYTIGISDVNKLEDLDYMHLNNIPYMICVDVANGYNQQFIENVSYIREMYLGSIIMAGNVATPEMTQELLIGGRADIVKVGIGPGCFIGDTLIQTTVGLKKIADVCIGDSVLTHNGTYQKVIGTKSRQENNKLLEINDNICTTEHEFYVLHQQYYKHGMTYDDTAKFGEWIQAQYLNPDHYLLICRISGRKPFLSGIEIYEHNLQSPENVYDIEVENSNSFCVGYHNIIVHNSACTTRKVTGVGYPQLSAIMECADVAHGLGGHICADGGCREVGDICKAFGAGADFVMLGGLLAGSDECDGEWIYKNAGLDDNYKGQKTGMKFYGMASQNALDKYGQNNDYRTSEGQMIEVPYKGPVSNVIQQIQGGLRSACAYVGARTLKDFPKCTTFIRT
jgi:IMP dehydrogenase/GMP reductase